MNSHRSLLFATLASFTAFAASSTIAAPEAPAASTPQQTPSPAAQKALTDIVKAQTKLHSLKSLTANITVAETMNGKTKKSSGFIKFLKPNYVWFETKGNGSRQYHISNGKDYCSNDAKGHWTSVKADPHGANFRNDLYLWSDFYVLFATDNAQRVVGGAAVTVSNQKVSGQNYEVINSTRKVPHPMTIRVYIAGDGLIHRMIVDGGPMHVDMAISHIKQNAPLKPREFQPHY